MFGRRIQSEALTTAGSPSLPATIDLLTHGSSALYLDTTYAAAVASSTPVAGQVLEWEFKINTGYEPQFTADARSDLDFTSYRLNTNAVGVEFNAKLLIPGTSPQFSTEKTAAEAAALRGVSLRFTGNSPDTFRLDFIAKHSKGSLFKFGDSDGQMVIDLNLVTTAEAVPANFIRAIVVNAVATDA
jgi:hypothetical protein